MNVPTNYLFVYGTLMQGFNNPFAEKLHESASFAGYGSFTGRLYQVSWYPGAVYLPDYPLSVYGEVYKLPTKPDLLTELDEYEDITEDKNQSLYLRCTIPVLMQNNMIIHCWTYIYNQSVAGLREIAGGDFRNPV